jgi:hypothetical protein
MTMTVGTLKEILQYVDDDMEIRLAHQPSWPLEFTVSDAVVVDINQTEDEMFEDEPDDGTRSEDNEVKEILYICEGSSTGYLPGVVSKHLGWR